MPLPLDAVAASITCITTPANTWSNVTVTEFSSFELKVTVDADGLSTKREKKILFARPQNEWLRFLIPFVCDRTVF